MRHEFDGVLDGLTYGAIIGFGFAMTENFLYFIGAFSEGGFVDLTVLIFLRAVIFGLNHTLLHRAVRDRSGAGPPCAKPR